MNETSSIPVLYGYIQKLQHIGDKLQGTIESTGANLISSNLKLLQALPAEKIACYLIVSVLFWCCFGWIHDDIRDNIKEKSCHGFDPEEFDYLSSNEAIPAKFNLVEAYIQMNDFDSATKVLKEIIFQGSQDQRQQAIKILNEIN